MTQTSENGKKPSFRPDSGPFGSTLGPKDFAWQILPLLDVRHCCKLSCVQFQGKLLSQT